MRSKFWTILLLGFTVILLITSCKEKEAPSPKPMGYFRLALPEHQYCSLDTSLPFTFERFQKSEIVIDKQNNGAYWVDINYPTLNAAFKITYFPIPCADSLRNLLIREEKMVKFHYQKADDVEYSIIKDPESPLYGQIYDIKGKDVATPLQFWMTDSLHHFLRATLYFNFAPNNDSLQPVIDYLREDAMHLINTFEWK